MPARVHQGRGCQSRREIPYHRGSKQGAWSMGERVVVGWQREPGQASLGMIEPVDGRLRLLPAVTTLSVAIIT